MKISKKERVFLLNQYRILAALDADNVSHYKELISILENGYEIFYSHIDEWILDDMPEEAGKFVLDILDLYRAIEDCDRINKNARILEHTYGYFGGFDGNNESEYLGFARFLVNEQGKFSEQKEHFRKNDHMNSHMPMIDKYKKMIDKWDSFRRPWPLSVDQVFEILES